MALGHAARTRGRPEEALAHYDRARALAPDNAEAVSAVGIMLLHLNRLDEATAQLRRAVEIEPSHAAARFNLAEVHARQGDVPDAIRMVEALATEAPQQWWIWDKLGELEAMAGRFPEAAARFASAVERKQNDPSLLYKWSRATFDAGSPGEAKAILDQAARLAPAHEAILGLYAEIHEQSSDWDNLGRTAESWLRLHPQAPPPWMYVARAQWESGYLALAMQSYQTFMDRGGKTATNLATFGRLCLAALAYDKASAALDEAERLDAHCAHMLSAKAALSMFRGDLDDARSYARRAIDVDPRDAAAFKVLVQVAAGHLTEDEQAQLRRLSEDGNVRPEDRISALFALADTLDAKDSTADAFAAYERANSFCAQRAWQQGFRYDQLARKRQTDELISISDAPPPPGEGSTGPIPIFIVGMPRSGTTLIESILGAHSNVFACGERQAMRSIMQEFASLSPARGLSGVPEGTRERWREAYWRELPDVHGAIAVTDKNPWNFDALCMIFALFPDARVIHVQRDPVEVGLSVFRHEFSKFAAFTCRLEDIGHYYGEYARLMAHWQRVLPNRFITIQYEELVADLAGGVPGLLEYCGLPFEPGCVDFSSSQRIISTMSTVQARQPVSAFTGRVRRYLPHLSPLVSALRDAGVELRSDGSASSLRSP